MAVTGPEASDDPDGMLVNIGTDGGDSRSTGKARLISASRRTDIAAFYSKWFLHRLREGYCHSINPFGGQVKRVPLHPADVLGIVFWTRCPLPLMPHLRQLAARGYRFYFQFTITGYDRLLDTRGPEPAKAVETFRRLADEIGPPLVLWRYDPIILSDRTLVSFHLKNFSRLASKLEGFTERCSISFVSWYGKTKRNLDRAARSHGVVFQQPDLDTRRPLARELGQIAAGRGMRVLSCCEDALLQEGVGKAHCVDLEPFRFDPAAALRSSPTRKDCGCVESVDIGAYDTCLFGCLYCYATNSHKAAAGRRAAHDPLDTVLWRPPTPAGKLELD